MKTYLLFLLFLLSSSLMFCQIKGQWRQMHPELNGEVPAPRGGHSMCPIGDEQALMTGGENWGNPYYYSNETWLYDYKSDKWTRIGDFAPNTDLGGGSLFKLSKKRAICRGYIFDLDSMKWFISYQDSITGGFSLPTGGVIYLEDNLLFRYKGITTTYPNSYLIRIDTNQSFDSPNFASWELINDEGVTKFGPGTLNLPVNAGALINFSKHNPVSWIAGRNTIPGDGMFIDMEKQYEWNFFNDNVSKIPYFAPVEMALVTNNIALQYYNDGDLYDGEIFCDSSETDLLIYDSANNCVNYYPLDLDVTPNNLVWGPTLAQLKDGVVMLFGGGRHDPFGMCNETWIFELDKDIVDNKQEPVEIYTLEDNIYQLGEDIKDATLYNVLGQQVAKYEDGSRINLNHLPTGMYFLQYEKNKENKISKIIKK